MGQAVLAFCHEPINLQQENRCHPQILEIKSVAPPRILAAENRVRLTRVGGAHEWHVVLDKSFEHIVFGFVPWFHEEEVLLVSPLS